MPVFECMQEDLPDDGAAAPATIAITEEIRCAAVSLDPMEVQKG